MADEDAMRTLPLWARAEIGQLRVALSWQQDRVAELEAEVESYQRTLREEYDKREALDTRVAELEALTDWLRLHEPDAFYRARRAALRGDGGEGGSDDR